MFDLKKILKIIFSSLLLGGLAFLFFFAKNNQDLVWETVKNVQKVVKSPIISIPVSEKELSEQVNPKEIIYKWQYNGKDYELKETLFESTNIFYQNSPKSYKYHGEMPVDWEEKYYGMFFQVALNDLMISKLASDLKSLGEKNKLSEDQTVELILAFVQTITYDDAKANVILSSGKESINYTYETLFEQKGVCSDKSILAAAIFRQLGYGTALFTYEAEKHMALGIKCPVEYSNNDSGYCYAETTSTGFQIGMLPDFDQNNRAVVEKEIKNFEENQIDQFSYKRLGVAKIFQKTDGEIYNGIEKTISIAKEIDSLKISISDLKEEISSDQKKIKKDEAELADLISDMNKLKKKEKYDEYNDAVDDYNDLAKDFRNRIKKYNSLIKTYNQKVARYNYLIKGF